MARHRGKFVSYLRVSTKRQGESGLGLEGQRTAVETFLNGGSLQLVEEHVEVESGKDDRNRPATPDTVLEEKEGAVRVNRHGGRGVLPVGGQGRGGRHNQGHRFQREQAPAGGRAGGGGPFRRPAGRATVRPLQRGPGPGPIGAGGIR